VRGREGLVYRGCCAEGGRWVEDVILVGFVVGGHTFGREVSASVRLVS
jgi:hypothetical protein